MNIKDLFIIAVDFDGTLVEDNFPEIGKDLKSEIDYIRKLQRILSKDKFKFILWTCRTGERLEEAIRHTDNLGLRWDAINDNIPEVQSEFGGNARKIYANVYIDDKAIEKAGCLLIPCKYLDTQAGEWGA